MMKASFSEASISPKPGHVDSLSAKPPKPSRSEKSETKVNSEEKSPRSFEAELDERVADPSKRGKGAETDSAGAAMISAQKVPVENGSTGQSETVSEDVLPEDWMSLLAGNGDEILKETGGSLVMGKKGDLEKAAHSNLADGKNLTPLLEKKPSEENSGKSALSVDRAQVRTEAADPSAFKGVLPEIFLKESAARWQAQVERAEIGINNALKEDMTKTLLARSETEARNGVLDGSVLLNRAQSFQAKPMEKLSVTQPSDLIHLMDRVQRAVDSRILQQPRHLVIQLDPPSLGRVEIHLARNVDGWNVDWSVSRAEIKEWLTLQLPNFQRGQKEFDVPIIWNPPVLQGSADDPRQGNSSSERAGGDVLPLDEAEAEEAKTEKSNSPGLRGYWA